MGEESLIVAIICILLVRRLHINSAARTCACARISEKLAKTPDN